MPSIVYDFNANGVGPDNVIFDGEFPGIHQFAYEYGPEEERYFYHSDHLGSSTFITDAAGNPYQFLQYLPFGEPFVSQHVNMDGWGTLYTFSAKEQDAETGYHYFGARYYDSELSVWLSVDPLASKFPEISAYAYCYHNPLNFFDKWGLEGVKVKIPGDEEVNAGSGYKQTEDKKYLYGDGLQTKVWDTDAEVGTHSGEKGGYKGAYVNYEGDAIDFENYNNEAAANGGGSWWSDAYNSGIGRMVVPDFLAVGVGFNGIAGVGGGTSIEFRWVTHGPEASWKPMITVTQSVGGGFSVDATLNIEAANYIGNVNNITRSMMQTSSPNGDFPTIWGSGGVAAGGKIGVTGYVTPNVGGSFIIGRELNLGAGLPAGPLPANGAGGASNTWILYDFYK